MFSITERVAELSGNAVKFDAVDDYVDFNDTPYTTGGLTVSAWVMPVNAPFGLGRNIAKTFDWNVAPSPSRRWNLSDEWDNSDHLGFCISDIDSNSVNAEVDGFSANYANEWVHIIGVFRPGEEVALYLNGNLVAQEATTITQIASYSTNFRLGMRCDSSIRGLWSGLIDEVKIWDRALSDFEISTQITCNDPQ